MQNFIAIISLVAQLFPVAIQLVTAIEAQLPQGGQGATKLEMVRAALASAFAHMQSATVTFEQVWPSLSGLISGLVTAYNAIGLFKKSTPVV